MRTRMPTTAPACLCYVTVCSLCLIHAQAFCSRRRRGSDQGADRGEILWARDGPLFPGVCPGQVLDAVRGVRLGGVGIGSRAGSRPARWLHGSVCRPGRDGERRRACDIFLNDLSLGSGGMLAGLRLRPGTAAAVIGAPAREVRYSRVPLGVFWGAAAGRRLADGLLSGATARQTVAVLEHALLARLADAAPAVDEEVARAMGILQVRPGCPVACLAREVGLDPHRRRMRRRRTIPARRMRLPADRQRPRGCVLRS
jgi:hypothetical protein